MAEGFNIAPPAESSGERVDPEEELMDNGSCGCIVWSVFSALVVFAIWWILSAPHGGRP